MTHIYFNRSMIDRLHETVNSLPRSSLFENHSSNSIHPAPKFTCFFLSYSDSLRFSCYSCVLAFEEKGTMMLPDSPQNIVVVRAPSPSIHYIPGSINGDNLVAPTTNQQQIISQPMHSMNQPVSESWCLTSVKVIKVKEENGLKRGKENMSLPF